MRGMLSFGAMLMIMSGSSAFGQYSNIQTKSGSEFPTVVFSCSRRQGNPPYYSIAVDSTGDATYESTPASVSQTGLPYTVEFFASSPTRAEIFRIAQALHFFQNHIKDSTHSGGTHTLVFVDGNVRNQAKYHEPSDPRALALTSLFEKISNTLEFGRRLANMEQSNPGGIEAELQQMTRMMRAQQLAETQAVTAVLEQIKADSHLSETSREQAGLILVSLNNE